MLILPDAHMASICACIFLGWQKCRGSWKDWSGLSADWSCCLQGHTGLLGTAGKLTVSTEVGLHSCHYWSLCGSLNFVPIIGFSWNISVNSFLCNRDINQMQVIPKKEKKRVSIHSPQKLPLSVPVNSTIHELNVIILSFQCLYCSSTFSD